MAVRNVVTQYYLNGQFTGTCLVNVDFKNILRHFITSKHFAFGFSNSPILF